MPGLRQGITTGERGNSRDILADLLGQDGDKQSTELSVTGPKRHWGDRGSSTIQHRVAPSGGVGSPAAPVRSDGRRSLW
jgi:hypothetical protein